MPSTRLFAMSIGVMAMQAGACGFCSCTETLPSSWKTNSDVHEKVNLCMVAVGANHGQLKVSLLAVSTVPMAILFTAYIVTPRLRMRRVG